MKRSKILIIDKDILVRQAIANLLQKEESNLEVIVSDKIQDTINIIFEVNPELVLLNLEDPDQENLEMLAVLRFRYPQLPVIVLCKRTKDGAKIAIEALRQGAIDFITKPENGNILLFAERHLLKRLLPAVETSLRLQKRNLKSFGEQHKLADFEVEKENRKSIWPVNLIVIGSGTGGPGILFLILPELPQNLSVPVVIAQHFPQKFTNVLADELNKAAKIEVLEARDGMELQPGKVYLAPGSYHCELQRSSGDICLKCHRGPRENDVRPSVDVLFRSAGRLYGPGVLGVVLSGCGEDGLAGARVIRQAGGRIIVQDPDTATAPGMPLSILKAGLSDGAFDRDELAEQIINLTMGMPVETGKWKERSNIFHTT